MVFSTASKQIFDSATPSDNVYFDCSFPNAICSIIWSSCSFQYVGYTDQKISKIFNSHEKYFKHPKKYRFWQILSDLLSDSTRIYQCHAQTLVFLLMYFLKKFEFYLQDNLFDSPNFFRRHFRTTTHPFNEILSNRYNC